MLSIHIQCVDFFFKQKTAYEMRISDWSSDVCSSDLLDLQLRRRGVRTVVIGGVATNFGVESTARSAHEHGYAPVLVEDACASLSADLHDFAFKIGRASCRERVCQYV